MFQNLKKSAEKLSREIVMALSATVVVAGIAYATATIPVTCTTPGDCPDITPTFQSLNLDGYGVFNENEVDYSVTHPNGRQSRIEINNDLPSIQREGVGISSTNAAGDRTGIISTGEVSGSPIAFLGIRDLVSIPQSTQWRAQWFAIQDGATGNPMLFTNVRNAGGAQGSVLRISADDVLMGTSDITPQFRLDIGTGNVGIGISANIPAERVELDGAIIVADTVNPCTATNEGAIRYDGTDFFGCDGTTWLQLNN